MQCPVDNTVLEMTERQGVEIDYCPQCRGVWLDRGELDKIIDRGAVASPPPTQRPTESRDQPGHRDGSLGRPYSHDRDDERPYPKKKRKESFLGDLFDF